MPPGSPARRDRPAVRVPASPVAVEASPALSPQPGFPELPLNPKPRGQEDPPGYRIPEKPVPEVAAPAPTPWPGATTRAEAPIPADAPAAAPPAPPAIPEQIVSAVVPLHGRGDGRHEMTLELRPEELGTIRVDVSVEHQTVHLTLHAAEPATGRLLSAALADLRSALADAGLQAGHVAVSPDGGSGPGRRSRPQTEPAPHLPGKTTPTTAVPATTPVLRPATAGRLDLLL
jgi:flagellar hook-length control protein FliK